MNAQCTIFSIGWMAKKLDVTRSGYYAWLHRQDNPGLRAQKEEELGQAIELVFIDIKNAMARLGFIMSFEGRGLALAANAWPES